MTLTLEVPLETVQRVERAKLQGADTDTLLCIALEQWFTTTESQDAFEPHFLSPLAGKYEGEAWDELLTEMEKSQRLEAM